MAGGKKGEKPKWRYLGWLGDQLLLATTGKKESGGRYVFRGLGRVDGAYPSASTPAEFLGTSLIKSALLTAIDTHKDRHDHGAIARLFCPTVMGPKFPGHEAFDDRTRAAAVLAHAVVFPNAAPASA